MTVYIQCRDNGVPWYDMCFRVYEECIETGTDFRMVSKTSFFKTKYFRKDIFVGDVTLTNMFIRQVLAPGFQMIGCYPEEFRPFYGRQIRLITIEEFQKENRRLFVKPKDFKIFNGGVQRFSDIEPYLPAGKSFDEILCYVAEPIEILAEYRCFVHRGELVGVQHAYGNFHIYPDTAEIQTWISQYTSQPVAYCLDVGLTKNGQIVVEVNDVLCSGTYGFDTDLLQILKDRYAEIIAGKNAGDGQQ
ncbi:MAG: ATP-grasp domain-containing protein [Myxococcota bacterium]